MIKSLIPLLLLFCLHVKAVDLFIKDGETVIFFGDSITREGNQIPGGWIHLFCNALQKYQVKVRALPSGVGGNDSNHLRERFDHDVLGLKADWVFLNCGLNDVENRADSVRVPLPQYRENITLMLQQARKSGMKVLLITPTRNEFKTDRNIIMEPYVEFLHQLASTENVPLADANKVMKKLSAAAGTPGGKMTRDGVHFNGHGNVMFATVLLAAIGVPDKDIGGIQAEWNKLRGGATMNLTLDLTLEEYKCLEKEAIRRGCTPARVMYDHAMLYIKSLP